MADILNPNRSIADKYEMWTVIKKNGEKLSGIIASETPAAITLHNIGAQEIIVARADIKTLEVFLKLRLCLLVWKLPYQ